MEEEDESRWCDRCEEAERTTTTTTRSSVLPVMELAKVDDSVYGPVLCVIAAAWVGWTFFNGAKETKEIGEELSAKDTTPKD